MFRLFSLGFCLFLSAVLHAATNPTWTIIPTTPTSFNMPINGTTTVQYRVKNNTYVSRTLTFKPIEGVTQITSGAGVCPRPFTLAHNQSCLLTLFINGNETTGVITGGPVVCKAECTNNLDPNTCMCAQPSAANSLNITAAGAHVRGLNLSPSTLTLVRGESNVPLTVTNLSGHITEMNIRATIPPYLHVIQDASGCTSLAPEAKCQLLFTPGDVLTSEITIPVQGTGSPQATFILKIAEVRLSVSPSILTIDPGIGDTVTVTNQSASTTANNISVTIPSGSLIFIQSTTCGTIPFNLNPGASCTITFNASSQTSITPVVIEGSNTSVETVYIRVKHLFAYVGNGSNNSVSQCSVDSVTGSLTSCGDSGAGAIFLGPNAIAFHPTLPFAYVTDGLTNEVTVCAVDTSSGQFIANQCINYGSSTVFNVPNGIAINPKNSSMEAGHFAYVANGGSSAVLKCPINPITGGFGNCVDSGGTGFSSPSTISLSPNGQYAYVVNAGNTTIVKCTVNLNDGSFNNCAQTGSGLSNTLNAMTLNMPGDKAYIATSNDSAGTGSVLSCPLANTSTGELGICTDISSNPPNFGTNSLANPNNIPTYITLNPKNNFAYLPVINNPGNYDTIVKCAVNLDGSFGLCVDSGWNQVPTPNNITFD